MDYENPIDKNPDTSQFTVRPAVIQFKHVMLLGALVVATTLFGIYTDQDSSAMRDILIMGLIFVVILVLYYGQGKVNEDKTASEFQAMVFSGAMRANNILRLITYQDGSVYYLDARYVRNFEGAKNFHNLDEALETMGVPKNDIKEVLEGIAEMKPNDVKSTIEHEGKKMKVLIEVAPIIRPQEFVSITFRSRAR